MITKQQRYINENDLQGADYDLMFDDNEEEESEEEEPQPKKKPKRNGRSQKKR